MSGPPVRAVHQFHSGSAVGDAVTNGMLLTRRLLRRLGYRSEIFVQHRPAALERERYEDAMGAMAALRAPLDRFFEAVTVNVEAAPRKDVLDLVVNRLAATFELALAAFAIALALGIGLGMLAALKQNTVVDFVITAFTMIGLAIPPFWLGLILIIVFAVRLQILPVSGSETAAAVVLPAITLSLQSTARLARLLRSSMIEVLEADYVRTARAKGLTRRRVLWLHAFRNALIPLVTMAGLELGDLISSAVVIEEIFAWPGLARLAITAVAQRDCPLLQGAVLVAAACFVTINLVVDWLYTRIDPRVALR